MGKAWVKILNTVLLVQQNVTTRMHSSGMRTACSSSRPGGLHQAPPRADTPQSRHPPEQTPPSPPPPGSRHPPPVNRILDTRL